jgi:putative IMPACT (imprinted ancient) family translation regulator
VVVVRYFGGTKLGVPGLIAAYKLAAADVLNKVEIVEQLVEKHITVSTSFEAMNEMLKILKQFQGTLVEQKYTEDRTEITIDFRLSVVENVLAKINSLQVVGVDLHIVTEEE